MSGARLRFGLALALFLGWLGWLGYFVARQSREQPVSRPQILAAEYLIIGRVEAGADGTPQVVVKIERVYANGLTVDDFIDWANGEGSITGIKIAVLQWL